MNKQELIDELIYELENVSSKSINKDFEDGYNGGIRHALELVKEKKLDEPKKVVVPKFVAEWLDKHKYSTDIIDLFLSVEYATDSDGFVAEKWDYSGKFYDWLSNSADIQFTLCDAMRYGYEVEKELTYVISIPKNSFYKHYLARFINNNFEKPVFRHIGEEDPLFFKDKEKAIVIADWVKGTVETFEEEQQ